MKMIALLGLVSVVLSTSTVERHAQQLREVSAVREAGKALSGELETARQWLAGVIASPGREVRASQQEAARVIARDLEVAATRLRTWLAALEEAVRRDRETRGAFGVLLTLAGGTDRHPFNLLEKAFADRPAVRADVMAVQERVRALRTELQGPLARDPQPAAGSLQLLDQRHADRRGAAAPGTSQPAAPVLGSTR